MENLFVNIFQMSISASYLILAVLIVRFLLRKAPKSMRSFLWLLVGIRLLIPFSVESVFSLIPNTQTVDEYIYEIAQPGTNTISNTANTNTAVSQPASGTFTPAAERHMNKTQAAVRVCTKIWLAGMALMLGYLLTSWLRLRNRVKMSVPMDISLEYGHTCRMQKVYQNSAVESPFLFGIIRPRIYIPNSISEEELPYVVQHEMTHLKRKDYLIKPAGFLLLSVYWFNPCVWTAYIMLCKDIELICDEKVIRQLGASCKKAYSQALLNCAADRRMIAACPVAFGEVSVKERVKNVLNYKKPAFWVLVAAVLACIIVPVCFMTQKKTDASEKADLSEEIQLDGLVAGEYEMLTPDHDKYLFVPRLSLDNDGRFSFAYNLISSYLPYGTYELKDNILTAVTDDGKYHFQFTCVGDMNNGPFLFDAEHSSNVSDIDKKGGSAAPIENGSIFIKNTVSAVLRNAKDISQALNQQLTQGITLTAEELHEKQAELVELQKQLALEEAKLQRQLEGANELQLEQEEIAVLKTELQKLIQEVEDSVQQLEENRAACQAVSNAAENLRTAYNAVEQWAQAFCDRNGAAIVKLADEVVEQQLLDNDILMHGFDGEEEYFSFGWSSPWPWGSNYDENAAGNNYRIIDVTDRSAEILYYAWVSDPHVTVWRELLTYRIDDGELVITSETLQFREYICTAQEFYQAYPDGITGTMMDYYSYNGAGEALNNNAKNSKDYIKTYSVLFEPDSAAVYMLNILDNPNKVGRQVTKSDTNTCTVTFEFYEDGGSVDVHMIQPYGSDGIWLPYSDDTAADSGILDSVGSIAPHIITSRNVDDILAEDAEQIEALFPDHHEFAFKADISQNVDLNGDGVEEKIEMSDLFYNGGDGGYALKVTDTKTGEQIPLPDGYTEEGGFPVFASYSASEGEDPQLLIQLGEENRRSVVAAITQDALVRIYERNNMYKDVRDDILSGSDKTITADAISGYNIVTYKNEENPVILLKTYISGFAGHIDTLGYVVTELRLQEDNTWASRHYFLLDSCDDIELSMQRMDHEEIGNDGLFDYLPFLPFNKKSDINYIFLHPDQNVGDRG